MPRGPPLHGGPLQWSFFLPRPLLLLSLSLLSPQDAKSPQSLHGQLRTPRLKTCSSNSSKRNALQLGLLLCKCLEALEVGKGS